MIVITKAWILAPGIPRRFRCIIIVSTRYRFQIRDDKGLRPLGKAVLNLPNYFEQVMKGESITPLGIVLTLFIGDNFDPKRTYRTFNLIEG
jgi:hypothetical protein